jgi:hypothetical protein
MHSPRTTVARLRQGWATLLILTVGATVAVLGVGAAPASAYPGKPLTEFSFYVHTTNTTTAYNLGCNQGSFDGTHGLTASRVTLAYGVQKSNLSGNILTGTGATITRAQVEAVAENLALGYYACSPLNSTLYLNLGTNNDNSTETSSMGNDWGNVVHDVNNWISGHAAQVLVQGANDMEPGFAASYSSTLAWANGYNGNSNAGLYLNFGSADGCPQTTHTNGACNNGWNQRGLWTLSWNIAAAICAPEIYYTANAKQWEQIALYGGTQGNTSHYIAVWDEYDLNTATLSPQGAWDAFLTQLYSNSTTASAPLYSMEIHNE